MNALGAVAFDLGELSRRIDTARSERDITWAQLSRDVGVSASTIRRFASATDAEADGVLALIRWLGATPEEFVADSSIVGEPLAPSGDAYVRVDMTAVEASGGSGSAGKPSSHSRTTIQRLVWAAQEAGVTVASLTRLSAV